MKVKRNTLLLIACLVWGAAGFNILRLGVLAYPAYLSVLNFVLSALVFAVFQYFIFGRLVKKHTARITGYEEERHFFLKFFDVKSFIIMAVMMSGGICRGCVMGMTFGMGAGSSSGSGSAAFAGGSGWSAISASNCDL